MPNPQIDKVNVNGTTYDIKDANASTATNWVNGSVEGSVRGIRAKAEDSSYTMGVSAVAEGYNTSASGPDSHAEGCDTTATGYYAHAEGQGTTASNYNAHAEGQSTTASGADSHAEGYQSTASGSVSHVEGYNTVAQRRSQHVFGEFNILDTTGSGVTKKGDYIEIVGNGTANNARSNARTLDWSGNEVLAGTITATNIPAPPNSNGTYYLTVVVNNGALTYSWSALSIYDGTVETNARG